PHRADVPQRPRRVASASRVQSPPVSIALSVVGRPWSGLPAAATTEGLRTMNSIDFDKAGGLVPAIAQDAETGEVLMLAWMNREAFEETVRSGRAGYYSRSRNKPWRKGEESGHVPLVQGH